MSRTIGYLWAAPVTLVGIFFAITTKLSGGSVHVREGVVEAIGGFAAWFLRGGRYWKGGAAMTLGHVVLARDADCLARSWSHELVHVRQFETWGPLLLPVYWLIAAWLWLRGFDPYLDHPFEVGLDPVRKGTDQ